MPKKPTTLRITIDLENDAFQDEPHIEVLSILDDLTRHIRERGLQNKRLHDCNGNHAGDMTLR